MIQCAVHRNLLHYSTFDYKSLLTAQVKRERKEERKKERKKDKKKETTEQIIMNRNFKNTYENDTII